MMILFKRWFWLVILITSLLIFLYFGFDKYLSFTFLRENRAILLSWVVNHYVITVVLFMLLYVFAVAISFPGASYLTITSGFLFGAYIGTLYVVISATIGSVIIFLAVRHAVNPSLTNDANSVINKMRHGFKENEVRYLLFLRLLPIFPFWAVNIAAALFNVRVITFVTVTLIGIVPGAFIYGLLGSGLGRVLDQNKPPNLYIIFDPYIFTALFALAVLTLLPVIYKYLKKQ